MKSLLFIIAAILVCASLQSQELHWYKGNTHTHTTNSDGNELPRRVVRWYQDHNYNFLVISDHNLLTSTTYLDTDPNDDFLLIPGEEVTDSFQKKPVHVNGLGISSTVDPKHGKTMVQTFQNDIDAIRFKSGVPQINHPNWRWSFGDSVIAQLKKVKLFEVYNFNKDVNNFGAGGLPGTEAIWDALLSRSMLIYGVASDDTHEYLAEFMPEKATPGKAWIMVRAKVLNQASILDALEKGDFYGSTGVTLKNITITKNDYTIEIESSADFKYTTLFIGKDGKILKEDYSLNPSYTFTGGELYVRAKINCSSGDFAFTQPVFIGK
jgi:hypothetical protein